MTLDDGFYDVPAGKVAMVVTHLEMRAPVKGRAVAFPDGWRLEQISDPSCDWYRDLMLRVGGPWLWCARLQQGDDELTQILTHPDVLIWTLRLGEQDAALLELDFRRPGECELQFFGLAPQLIGSGAGRALMNTAISQAFTRPIGRFHLHTCTLDSPQALDFYCRSGFTPTRRQIEIMDDPRRIGVLDKALAPQVPML